MKLFGLSLLIGACLLVSARADLTIVHKVEGIGGGGEMTMKIKGDKMRIEVSPQITTIFDGKTGELTNLMNDQKAVVRISADKMKAAAEMINKFSSKKESAEKAKLVPTGKKETINGYETEQYAYDGPASSAASGSGTEITTTLISIKQDPLSDAEFTIPNDYQEMSMPDIFGGRKAAPSISPNP